MHEERAHIICTTYFKDARESMDAVQEVQGAAT